MRWYKHIADSLNDPDIVECIDRFGGDGYLVFFGTIEVMAKEFDVTNPGTVTIPIRLLTKSLQLSKQKTLKILAFFAEKTSGSYADLPRISHTVKGRNITLTCPKLKDLCDEWTQKKLRNHSGVTPDSIRPKDSESESEPDTEKRPPIPPAGDGDNDLNEIYQKYPELKMLHDVPMLRAISLEQWLKCKRKRSKHIGWMSAIQFVCHKAELQPHIKAPAAFLDSYLGYYEQDNASSIKQRTDQHDGMLKASKELAQFIMEIDAEGSLPGQDPEEAKSHQVNLFKKQYGKDAYANVEKQLKKLRKSK